MQEKIDTAISVAVVTLILSFSFAIVCLGILFLHMLA